jgi:hypothetical protein
LNDNRKAAQAIATKLIQGSKREFINASPKLRSTIAKPQLKVRQSTTNQQRSKARKEGLS